jgi:hypothetical protein
VNPALYHVNSQFCLGLRPLYITTFQHRVGYPFHETRLCGPRSIYQWRSYSTAASLASHQSRCHAPTFCRISRSS